MKTSDLRGPRLSPLRLYAGPGRQRNSTNDQASAFAEVPAKRESVMQVCTETRGLESAIDAGI